MVTQHGPGNLIVIEDDNEVVLDSKEEDTCGGHLLPPDGQLVLIEEEDPCGAVLEVECVMEREELRQRRFTMDDQAWWEAMETNQLVRNNLVPGYDWAPLYTENANDSIVLPNRVVFWCLLNEDKIMMKMIKEVIRKMGDEIRVF